MHYPDAQSFFIFINFCLNLTNYVQAYWDTARSLASKLKVIAIVLLCAPDVGTYLQIMAEGKFSG